MRQALGLTAAAVAVVWAVIVSPHVSAQPPIAPPLNVPVTGPRVELGRKLFFDPRLSAPVDVGGQRLFTVSCSTCHDPRFGFAQPLAEAVGILGRTGNRHSPTILNAAYSPLLFHDGRTIGLADQALLPVANNLEMGDQSLQDVINRLRRNFGYNVLFAEAYGMKANGLSPIDQDRFGHALASFQTTLVWNFDTPLHKRLRGDLEALTPQQERGFQLTTRARCYTCHTPPFFTDYAFHNNGMELATKGASTDLGRANVVSTAPNVRAFKTATWAELAKTAPYAHNGRMPDLARVVRHYNVGGAIGFSNQRDEFIDRRINPQGWTPADEQAVIALLRDATKSPTYPNVTAPRLP